jgi:hypothetical protein
MRTFLRHTAQAHYADTRQAGFTGKENAMEEQVLMIKVSSVEYDDKLSVRCTASPNLALGMIARARHELDGMEKQIYAELNKKKSGA